MNLKIASTLIFTLMVMHHVDASDSMQLLPSIVKLDVLDTGRILESICPPADTHNTGTMAHDSSSIPLHILANVKPASDDEAIRQLCILRMLAGSGYDINEADKSGRTALVIAIENGNERLAINLLRMKADPNVKHRRSDLPGDLDVPVLHLAAARSICLRELLSFGANLDATDSGGHTALHYAASMNQRQSYNILSNSGAKDIPSKNGSLASEIMELKEKSIRTKQ